MSHDLLNSEQRQLYEKMAPTPPAGAPPPRTAAQQAARLQEAWHARGFTAVRFWAVGRRVHHNLGPGLMPPAAGE